MGIKHAAVVAGLAFGLMSGVAVAAPITYDINVDIGSGGGGSGGSSADSASLMGTITTDGTIGTLATGNITAYNLVASVTSNGSTSTATIASPDDILFVGGDDLSAVSNGKTSSLVFAFSSDGGSFGALTSDTTNGALFSAGQYGDPGQIGIYIAGENQFVDAAGTITLGTAQLSTVPLPASAPMFGAALAALGAVGYGLKRKGKAAA